MHTNTSRRAHVHIGTATSGAEALEHREPSAMFLPQTEVPLPQAIGLCASIDCKNMGCRKSSEIIVWQVKDKRNVTTH